MSKDAASGTVQGVGGQDVGRQGGPVVGGPVSNRGVWIFGGVLGVVVVAMFSGLESRRAANTSLAFKEPVDQGQPLISAAPQLSIPAQGPPPFAARASPTGPAYPSFLPSRAPLVRRLAPRMAGAGWSPPAVAQTRGVQYGADPLSQAAGVPSGALTPEVVYGQSTAAPAPPPITASASSDRVEARHFLNPSTTVPKGTVMLAALESALDSTRPGFARAIVSRDVFSFDGSKVLVPKGSRLIGEYKADLALGQKRALIQWQRLVRPDGVVINLDSPSADPLGRAGVEGKVNSHFLARFGGSILQSALDLGVQVAANQLSSGTTILAVPGSLLSGSGSGQGSSLPGQEKVQPTLTVKQGTSVSVFVARDLDFTSVE